MIKNYYLKISIGEETKYLMHFDTITKKITYTKDKINAQCYLGIECLLSELDELLNLECLDNVVKYIIEVE